jgi:hypothetical protein
VVLSDSSKQSLLMIYAPFVSMVADGADLLWKRNTAGRWWVTFYDEMKHSAFNPI